MSIALSPLNLMAPRAVAPTGPVRIAKAAPNASAKRLRVLLVEDDDADVYLIRRALAELPKVAEVRVARDGVEAMELIDTWSSGPDLAIIDLKMPRKDGFTLLREFAARKSTSFPSIVLTSSKAGADVYRAKKRGAAEFITKPNGVDRLKNALGEALAKF